MREEPTEWRNWGLYAVSREGFLVVAIQIPQGKPPGTYLTPRLLGSPVPRYRLSKKGDVTTYKISDLIKKAWGEERILTKEDAEEMKKCVIFWNERRRNLANTRRSRLPETKSKLDYYIERETEEDPFTSETHPQYDPFSNRS